MLLFCPKRSSDQWNRGNNGEAKGAKGARGAKVNRKKVSLSQKKGGSGVKDLNAWNRACNMQFMWQLFQKASSLWIAWAHEYIMKGRSFWDHKIPGESY